MTDAALLTAGARMRSTGTELQIATGEDARDALLQETGVVVDSFHRSPCGHVWAVSM